MRWKQSGRIQRIGEKNGTKRSLLVEESGIPIAIVISGANTHDVKLLEETIDGVDELRPETSDENPQNLCLDAGYTGYAAIVEARVYISHIRPRGEEKIELERNPVFILRIGPKNERIGAGALGPEGILWIQ